MTREKTAYKQTADMSCIVVLTFFTEKDVQTSGRVQVGNLCCFVP